MTSELTKALIAFHQSVPTIHKTAKSYTNQYAPLDEVLSIVTPALSAQGLTFSHIFEPQAEGQPLLVCTLHHVSGETLVSKLPLVVQQGKHATQDVGSAITYLKRYTLLALLGLTADVDTDGNLDEPKTKPQAAPKAAPAPAPKPQAAPKPAPAAEVPTDLPVDPDQLEGLLSTVVASPNKAAIIAEARKVLGLAADAKIKPAITTQSQFDALLKICLEHE